MSHDEDDEDFFDYGKYNDDPAETNEDPFEDGPDSSASGLAMGSIVPYAHRDLKPANVMLDSSNRPVLMDLGSATRARVNPTTRQAALSLQDLAAENCTLPYRAPELVDVKTGVAVDEKTDIWSLGCTLYSIMYSSSPFELQAGESGASLSMAIQSGKYKFPSGNGAPQYSDELKEIINVCLVIDPNARANIDEILSRIEASLSN